MELFRLYLPVLFPSWRFFGEIGASPRISFLSEVGWRDVMERPECLPSMGLLARLVWNPDWNEMLFLAALAERLVVEPEPWIEREIAQRLMARHHLPVPPAFRISFVTPQGTESVYESPGHDA